MGVDVGTGRLRESMVGCRTVIGGANVSDPSAPLRCGRDDGASFSSLCVMAEFPIASGLGASSGGRWSPPPVILNLPALSTVEWDSESRSFINTVAP